MEWTLANPYPTEGQAALAINNFTGGIFLCNLQFDR